MELKNVAPASLPNLNICHTVSPVWKVPQLPAGGGVEGLALAGVSRPAQFSQARYLVPGFHPHHSDQGRHGPLARESQCEHSPGESRCTRLLLPSQRSP